MTDFNASVPFDTEDAQNPVIDDIPSSITEKKITTVEGAKNSEPVIIGEITSAAYGAFTKILSLLTGNMGKSDIISIEEGKLSTVSGGGHLFCDLSVLFGKNNFDIIDPQYNIKLLKLISGGDKVVFLDDDENSKYYISNLVEDVPQINITLNKPDASMDTKIASPNIGEIHENLPNIDPDLVNTVAAAEKNLDSQYFILELFEENNKYGVVSIATDKETFKYNFKDTSGQNPDLSKYKIFNPFPIPKPDEIDFQISKDDAGDIWVKTISEVGMAKIEYTEKLIPMGIFDSFSL